jgi:hypothetical protein
MLTTLDAAAAAARSGLKIDCFSRRRRLTRWRGERKVWSDRKDGLYGRAGPSEGRWHVRMSLVAMVTTEVKVGSCRRVGGSAIEVNLHVNLGIGCPHLYRPALLTLPLQLSIE